MNLFYENKLIKIANDINSTLAINWVDIPKFWVAYIENSYHKKNGLIEMRCGAGKTPRKALKSLYKKIKDRKLYNMGVHPL